MDDPRASFIKLINLKSSRVKLSPVIMLIFGGDLQPRNELDKSEDSSLRHKLYHHWAVKEPELSAHWKVVEDITDWINDGVYPDLLRFELDIAHLATLLVIIPESAGSIAELAAFIQHEEIKEKIVVILDDSYYQQDSFIKLGLLRNCIEENVFSFPLLNNRGNHKIYDDLLDIIDSIAIDIKDLLSSNFNKNHQVIFNLNNNGHIAFLIYEFIYIFKALKLKEIKHFLLVIGVVIDNKSLSQVLFVLDRLDLIQKIKYHGNTTFYSCIDPHSRIKFASTDVSVPFDRAEIEISIMDYYQNSDHEQRRFKFIQEYCS